MKTFSFVVLRTYFVCLYHIINTTISGDLHIVRPEALMTPYRSTRASIAGKLLLERNQKGNIGCMGGLWVPKFYLARPAN